MFSILSHLEKCKLNCTEIQSYPHLEWLSAGIQMTADTGKDVAKEELLFVFGVWYEP